MYTIRIREHFDAAHYIRDYVGKCSSMHGHRWDVEVALTLPGVNVCNLAFDFTEVKGVVRQVLAGLDHQVLNEVMGEPNITAEFLSRWLFVKLEELPIHSVRVWENPDCSVEYNEDSP